MDPQLSLTFLFRAIFNNRQETRAKHSRETIKDCEATRSSLGTTFGLSPCRSSAIFSFAFYMSPLFITVRVYTMTWVAKHCPATIEGRQLLFPSPLSLSSFNNRSSIHRQPGTNQWRGILKTTERRHQTVHRSNTQLTHDSQLVLFIHFNNRSFQHQEYVQNASRTRSKPTHAETKQHRAYKHLTNPFSFTLTLHPFSTTHHLKYWAKK